MCPFSKLGYTSWIDVEIMNHTPKLHQLNLLSCCYLFIIMVFHAIKKKSFLGR